MQFQDFRELSQINCGFSIFDVVPELDSFISQDFVKGEKSRFTFKDAFDSNGR